MHSFLTNLATFNILSGFYLTAPMGLDWGEPIGQDHVVKTQSKVYGMVIPCNKIYFTPFYGLLCDQLIFCGNSDFDMQRPQNQAVDNPLGMYMESMIKFCNKIVSLLSRACFLTNLVIFYSNCKQPLRL